jgi:hypothetical protein
LPNVLQMLDARLISRYRVSKFDAYRKESQIVNRWVNLVAPPELGIPLVFFGNANVNSKAIRKELAPTRKLKKALRLQFGASNLVLIDEFRTSKLCHQCGDELVHPEGVWHPSATQLRALRKVAMNRRRNKVYFLSLLFSSLLFSSLLFSSLLFSSLLFSSLLWSDFLFCSFSTMHT